MKKLVSQVNNRSQGVKFSYYLQPAVFVELREFARRHRTWRKKDFGGLGGGGNGIFMSHNEGIKWENS